MNKTTKIEVIIAIFLIVVFGISLIYTRIVERQAEEEPRLKQEIMKSVKEEEEDVVAAEGDVSKVEVFYHMDLNGFVAVYRSDKETIYEYTNIVVEDMPEDIRQEIKEGKEIRTVEKLYGFLENYSS